MIFIWSGLSFLKPPDPPAPPPPPPPAPNTKKKGEGVDFAKKRGEFGKTGELFKK